MALTKGKTMQIMANQVIEFERLRLNANRREFVTLVEQALADALDEVDIEDIAIEVRPIPGLQALLDVVGQAASELEGQGEKSDRIAQQLIEALALFARESGT